ncbi:FtsX-like permease family protein [Oleiharenicola sp. Vm1]|uniref:FtsX-like permease family protein n=1 Tax=Oleiharenicola sp. Vm1 TaxID=3398393 RepID=UPI0039F54087
MNAWRGRLFDAADVKPGAPLTTVLSYSAWQSRFNGADGAIGEVVTIDDVPHTVIGVLPPSFEFVDPVQFWRPLPLAPSAPGQLRIQMVRVFGRLLPGMSHAAAQRELDGISERFWNNLRTGFADGGPGGARNASAPASVAPDGERCVVRNGPDASSTPEAGRRAITAVPAGAVEDGERRVPAGPAGGAPGERRGPDGPAPAPQAGAPAGAGPGPRTLTVAPRMPFADAPVQLVPLQEQLAKQSRATLWLLLAAVGFVLLIACANLANLQLARAAGRQRDIAVRAALGASPTRLAAELLLENLLLALLGGLAGVVLAWWGTQGLQAWLADYLPRVNPVGVNATVLGFGLGLSLLAGLAFGLAPAWRGARIDLLETLKEGGHQASPGGHRWRQALVAFEVALALMLAINTGLLGRSIYQLYSTDLGFRTSDVMTANLSLPRRYATPAQKNDFVRRWMESLRGIPGVKTVAVTDQPPLAPYSQIVLTASVQGGTGNTDASVNAAPREMAVASVTPDFFKAAGIALKDGRAFTDQDGPAAPLVALVNESFVKQYYPAGLTLGAQLTVPRGPAAPGQPPPSAAIVGVVADTRPRGFDSTARPVAYFPYAQQPAARLAAVLQFDGDAAALARAVTQATHKVDTGLALDNPATLEDQIARQTAPRRVTLLLTSAFAATAIVLAALGIFGVMSYTVTQRTPEIGVRMALGADTGAILRWILRYGGSAVACGLVAGLGLTIATSRLLSSFLVGITALDPVVIALGIAALALIGLLACLLPALRATRVNPVEALRKD